MTPDDFWSPFEKEITNFATLSEAIETVSKKNPAATFAWRGQVNAGWALHSSLFRRLSLTRQQSTPPVLACPEEEDLYRAESDVLADTHRWGLHVSREIGRLSILNQLAALQHYGAPTRLIDVTFNPWIAAWFAVERKIENTNAKFENDDARMFAIDVTNRLINENEDRRDWEDALHRPWPKLKANPEAGPDEKMRLKASQRDWRTVTLAWRPPHFDNRIAAQNGGFIFGGVPTTYTADDRVLQWPKDSTGHGLWKIDEVRTATALALRPHVLEVKRGPGVLQNAVYTFRIKAAAKPAIRASLEKTFGYEHRTIYPDFTGFAQFGTTKLRTS